MIALFAFVVTLAAGALATYTVLLWLRRRAILDHPNERSSHSVPTPRGGGLALIPVVLVVWAILGALGKAPSGLWIAIAVGFALMIVSAIDDRIGLPAAVRLLAHVAAAVVGVAALPSDAPVLQGLVPLPVDRVIAVLAWVWFVNLYNFMDGIDGITGVETAAIGLGIALLAFVHATPDLAVAATLGAAGLGFLIWNWHPARIFMGDAGSVPFGFLLGWLLLAMAARGAWAAALILPGYYLADATITLVVRLLSGERVWQAHRRHFYQRALRGGGSHAAVAWRIAVADLLLIVLAFASLDRPWIALGGAALVVAALLAEFVRLGGTARG